MNALKKISLVLLAASGMALWYYTRNQSKDMPVDVLPVTKQPDAGVPKIKTNGLDHLIHGFYVRKGIPQSTEKYTVIETFEVSPDIPLRELEQLFYEDCEGVCFYDRDSKTTITKTLVHLEQNEPIQWYHNGRCTKIDGNNFWLYLEDGLIRRKGIGEENDAFLNYSDERCEDNEH